MIISLLLVYMLVEQRCTFLFLHGKFKYMMMIQGENKTRKIMSRDLQYTPLLKFLGPRVASKFSPLSAFLGTDMVYTFKYTFKYKCIRRDKRVKLIQTINSFVLFSSSHNYQSYAHFLSQ